MVVNMKVLMSLMFAVVVAHAARPKTATPKPGVPAWQRARGGPFAGAASGPCYESCALNPGCPQNFDLTNSGDATWLFTGKFDSQIFVHCDEGGDPAIRTPPRGGLFGVCENGAWVWKHRAGPVVTPADRPSCLIDSADCCQVRTSCPYDFTWNEPDHGIIVWRNTKEAESAVYIVSKTGGGKFGGLPNYTATCVDGGWEYEGEKLDDNVPDPLNLAYTSA